jgi:hypothetical protein
MKNNHQIGLDILNFKILSNSMIHMKMFFWVCYIYILKSLFKVDLNIICQNTNKAHNLKIRLQQLLSKFPLLQHF